ncbi:PQQ-dependent sugar dehydrogenase [Algoriphagus hitonicola]|uniref:Glucose/arabinose dehydrogenase, beta-propeller fold n=1 Tax=Algoriphagus hitonicola TaxID=435880 RepID=A0A1I2QH13_9BACT|nr:PQQ-dependent sugar dehydrogenase [Algoriphagus hitonicola]SFG27588.1 Glucose/arabinose dehydrogenase, beta-propeller fold [Algoriphagus hitonicola]
MKNWQIYVGLSWVLFSCEKSAENNNSPEYSTEPAQIQAGKTLFETHCSACHSFTQTTIGPNLSGLTREVARDWIKKFIANPSKLIDAGDPRAVSLFEEYKSYMPAFPQLKEDDLEDLLAYMHTFSERPKALNAKAITNPIPESVPDSGIELPIEFFAQIPASDSIPPLAKITKLESEPNSGRTFVQDQHGVLYELIGDEPKVFLDLKALRPKLISKPGLATGFGSYAFHPEYPQNGLLYTSHTEPGGTAPADFAYADSIPVLMQWVVTEWKTETPEKRPYQGEGRELLRINVVNQIHGMQELTFRPKAKKTDPDYGLLYIGIGDGGSAESGFPFIADHQGRMLWSSILRIDPQGNNSKNGKYGIPDQNPFVAEKQKAGEVFAYGFRNPNRIFWDENGQMYATDIGHHQIEELNLIEAGAFYGWPLREGTFVINPYGNMNEIFALPEDDAQLNARYPLIQLDHDELNAIIGGYFVKNGPFKGKWLFGDVPSGKLFIADLSDSNSPEVKRWSASINGTKIDLQQMVGGGRVDLKFGQDATGQLYLMTKKDGKIYKIKS